jgi:Asp-tRNA(Asn)/Glu-tRNA(Gln) amidotransferase C subunit
LADRMRILATASERYPILEKFNVFERFDINERERPARRAEFRNRMREEVRERLG